MRVFFAKTCKTKIKMNSEVWFFSRFIYFIIICWHIYLRHGCSLHFFDSVNSPSQSFPPWAGSGFEQVLFLFCSPPLHFDEHLLQALQSDRPPSIAFNWQKGSANPGGQLHFPLEKYNRLFVRIFCSIVVCLSFWVFSPTERYHCQVKIENWIIEYSWK